MNNLKTIKIINLSNEQPDDEELTEIINLIESEKESEAQNMSGSESEHSFESLMLNKLVETLQKPIDQNNKGYKMIKKLGYKEGELIGRNGHGLSDPLSVLSLINKKKTKRNNYKKKFKKIKNKKANKSDNEHDTNNLDENLIDVIKRKLKSFSKFQAILKQNLNYIIDLANSRNKLNINYTFLIISISLDVNLLTTQDYSNHLLEFHNKLEDLCELDIYNIFDEANFLKEFLEFLEISNLDLNNITEAYNDYNSIKNIEFYLDYIFEISKSIVLNLKSYLNSYYGKFLISNILD